jgi:hypothetical protein
MMYCNKPVKIAQYFYYIIILNFQKVNEADLNMSDNGYIKIKVVGQDSNEIHFRYSSTSITKRTCTIFEIKFSNFS